LQLGPFKDPVSGRPSFHTKSLHASAPLKQTASLPTAFPLLCIPSKKQTVSVAQAF
jgi:hypothetical protein